MENRCVSCGEIVPEGRMVCWACENTGQAAKVDVGGITANDYQLKALRTANISDKEQLLVNGVLGLAGETGEVADLIKKWKFQGHELDREKVIDELGDVCWYIAITAHAIGVTLEDVMQHNIQKLEKRYPGGFEREGVSIVKNEAYWQRICEMQEKQTQKGIRKYGQVLEENKNMTMVERLNYLQEELIDALMYCEHIKEMEGEDEGYSI